MMKARKSLLLVMELGVVGGSCLCLVLWQLHHGRLDRYSIFYPNSAMSARGSNAVISKEELIQKKFDSAGYSARWFFGTLTPFVESTIDTYVGSINTGLNKLTTTGSTAVNHNVLLTSF